MFPVSAVTEPSGMATLFGTAGVGAAPARDDVAPSSDVDVSSLGQFMGTLALAQKRLGELAAASGGRITDAELEQLGTAAGELVEAFNVGRAIDTLAPPSGEPLPANALAGRLAQAFDEQRAGLARLGIDLAPSLLGDDGDMLAVDEGRLLAAFQADRQGTLDALARAAGSFDEVASALAQERDAIGPDGNSLQPPPTTNLPPSEISDAAFRNALRDTAVQPNQQNAAPDAPDAPDQAEQGGQARQPEAPQIAGSGTPAAMLNNQAAELTAAQARDSASGALGPASSPAPQGPGQQAPAQQALAQQGPSAQGLGQQGPTEQVTTPQVAGPQVAAQQVPVQQAPVQQAPAQQVPAQQVPTQQVPNYAQPAAAIPLPAAANRTPSTPAETAAAQQAVRDTVQPPPTRVTGATGEAQANPVQTPPAATTSPDQANAEALARQLAAERFAAERAAVADNAQARREQVQRDDAARLERDRAALVQQERAAADRVAADRLAANRLAAGRAAADDAELRRQQAQRDDTARLDRATLTQQERAAADRLALARQTANEALAEQEGIVTQDQRLQEVRAAALRQLTTTRDEDVAAQQLADRLDDAARQEVRQDTLGQTDRLAQDRLLEARRAAAGLAQGTREDALVEQQLAQVRLAATRQAEDARQAAALTDAENARQRDALRVLQEQGAERAQDILDQERLALRTQQAAGAAGRGTAAGATALTGMANEQAAAGAAAEAQIAADAAAAATAGAAATAQAAADAAAAAQASLGTPANPAEGTTAGGTPTATGAPAGTVPEGAGTPGANAAGTAAANAGANNAPRAPNAADPSTAAGIAAQYLAGGIGGGPNANSAPPPRTEINPAVRPVTRTGTAPTV